MLDIQDITDWYNLQKSGLGKRFQNSVIKNINSLKKNPYIFAIRYNEIRCVPVKGFPYLIHYHLNEGDSKVEVMAVISTDRDTKIWEEKTNKG